jgi:phosphohistidine phosphatase SixA
MIAIHLLRHAHAGDAERWSGDDAERPLSDKGRRQSERLGLLLKTYDDAPDVFITSPKVRAARTADIVAAALGAPVIVDPRLAAALDSQVLRAILADHPEAKRPCVVGHDPAFSTLLGDLIGLPELPMRKGALARVDVSSTDALDGGGTLRYLLPPELLPAT